jgi:hypothetical protein
VLSDGESLPTAKPKGRQPKSVSARRKHNHREALEQVDEESFKDLDHRIQDNDQYTLERCEELETAYWKSLVFNNPWYGADMPGSLFDDSTLCWNVARLPNLLDVLDWKVRLYSRKEDVHLYYQFHPFWGSKTMVQHLTGR